MVRFLKTAFVDLNNRIRKLKAKLSTRGNAFDFGISTAFVQDTLKLLENLEAETIFIIESGALDFDLLMPNNLYIYNGFVQRYEVIDSYRSEIILKYDAPELFFNRLLVKIYAESGLVAIPKPIVTTTSNSIQYYWTAQLDDMQILALPAGEDECLLNLPDIYHEIAHLLCIKYKGVMLSNFITQFKKYCHAERVRAKNEKVNADYRQDELQKIENFWCDKWIWELACDLIAVYLVGPAYAWTAMKLNAKTQGEDLLYRWKPKHPPDAARMQVILLMLEKLGLQHEQRELHQVWTTFLQLTKNPKPKYYNTYFPESFLNKLVNDVYEFCDEVCLTPVSTLLANHPDSFAVVLNDSWKYAISHQNLFDIYERKTLESLRMKLGLVEDNSVSQESDEFDDSTQF